MEFETNKIGDLEGERIGKAESGKIMLAVPSWGKVSYLGERKSGYKSEALPQIG